MILTYYNLSWTGDLHFLLGANATWTKITNVELFSVIYTEFRGGWICWSEFTAVFLQRIRWVASLGYPTLGKDYRANKPVSILSHKMALHWRPHRRDEKYNLKKGSHFFSQSSHTLTEATEAILSPLKSSYFFEGCATMLAVLFRGWPPLLQHNKEKMYSASPSISSKVIRTFSCS